MPSPETPPTQFPQGSETVKLGLEIPRNHAAEIAEWLSGHPGLQGVSFFDIPLEPTQDAGQGLTGTAVQEELKSHFGPEAATAREVAQDQEILLTDEANQKQTEIEQATRDIEGLKTFVASFGPAGVATDTNELAIVNNKLQSIHTTEVKFQNTDLHTAGQLNALAVWANYEPLGRFDDEHAAIYGSTQYLSQTTPAFMVGSHYLNDKEEVSVLFAAPSHKANMEDVLGEDIDTGKFGEIPPGDFESMPPDLYTITMSAKSFKKLRDEMERRLNGELPAPEASEILSTRTWPTQHSRPITLRRTNGLSKTLQADKFINESIGRRNTIAIDAYHQGGQGVVERVTPDSLAASGGLELYDTDRYLTELALAFDETDHL